jgi:acetyl esterase/lipase
MRSVAVCALFSLSTATIALCQDSSDLVIKSDLPYGPDPQEKADVIYPKGTVGANPAVVLIHGGAWRGGDKGELSMAAELLARQGFTVVNVNYRLFDGAKNIYPAAVDDVQKVVRLMRLHAAEYHIQPDHIGALGSSAGGHLAAMLGTCDTLHNDDPDLVQFSSRVEAVVDAYGPTDLTADVQGFVGVQSAKETLRAFLGGDKTQVPDRYKEASPIFHIDANSAPFLIYHGDKDTVVPIEQSKSFYAALKDHNIDTKLVILPGQGHGFDMQNTIAFYQDALAFLKAHLVR